VEKKKYYIVIGSVVFAVLTWISVNMRDEYTVVKHLPVILENKKEGKALKYAVPKSVSVRFRGNGWSLAGLYLSADPKYFIDLSSIGTSDFIITQKELLEHVTLPVAVQPVDVKPDTMLLALNEYQEKKISVLPRLVLDFQDGYGQVGPIRILPESITVGGSEQMTAQVLFWPTVYKKFDALHSPIDMELPLEEPENYSLDLLTQSVRLQINIQPFAEKAFSGIPLKASAVPMNREVIFIPPRMNIIVRGGIEQLAKLTIEDFEAAVSYQNLLQDSVESVIPLLTAPADVKVISRKPEKFQFIIRKRL
jgi:hypothetical protein